MDDFREVFQKRLKVEDAAVVERGRNAHVVERTCVALVVLNGVNKGVEHLGRVTHLLRSGRASLHQVIVVRIHASNHIRPQLISQCNLLPLTQRRLGGEHNFKIVLLRLQRSEQVAPERHIVKTLYIHHDTLPRMLPRQAVRRLDVLGGDVGGEGGHGGK